MEEKMLLELLHFLSYIVVDKILIESYNNSYLVTKKSNYMSTEKNWKNWKNWKNCSDYCDVINQYSL